MTLGTTGVADSKISFDAAPGTGTNSSAPHYAAAAALST
jgi:hypothetical protein